MLLHRFFIVFLVVSCVFGYKRRGHSRIVGGIKAPLGKFPYAVYLQAGGYYCGGSIISNRWILTAAHCIREGTNHSVLVGTVTLARGGVRYPIIKIIGHKDYERYTLMNDIALMKTETEISFSEYVSSIALGTEKIDGDVEVLLSGWGMLSHPNPTTHTNELFYVKLRTTTIIPQCKRVEQLCTLTKKGEGHCYGDSGGGLANKDNDKLVGVVSGSFSTDCAVGIPDLYTRVSGFINWIEENMRENS